MKKIKKVLFLVAFLCVISCSIIYKYLSKPQQVKSEQFTETYELKSKYIIDFDKFSSENFTCTGLDYDEKDKCFWIADYGALQGESVLKPKLVEVDERFEHIVNNIQLEGKIDERSNVQGVAVDTSNNTIWIAAGSTIYNLDKSGEIIDSISIKEFEKYKANGMCYDELNDSLWILCYSKYLINMDKTGKIIKKSKMRFKDQDQLCIKNGKIYVTVGADYDGNKNYIIRIDPATGKTETLFQIMDSYAVEGLCIVNNEIFVANDGLFHSAEKEKSYIAVYDYLN